MKRTIGYVAVAVLASVSLVVTVTALLGLTRLADAQSAPFSPVPAVDSIAALKQSAPNLVPEAVVRLGGEPKDVRELAGNGYAWTKGKGSVCVLMASGSGGCFGRFTKPVVLFMSGSTSHSGEQLSARAEGVVPDAVTAVEIVMADGRRIPVVISGNSFQTDLPTEVAIEGTEVSLEDGTKFFDKSPLSPLSPTRPRR